MRSAILLGFAIFRSSLPLFRTPSSAGTLADLQTYDSRLLDHPAADLPGQHLSRRFLPLLRFILFSAGAKHQVARCSQR